MAQKRKKIVKVVCIVISVWLVILLIDFATVASGNKPIFCFGITADDGEAGTYIGLGYLFDIKGNFMPEDEVRGVTFYSLKIFGIPVMTGKR